MTRFLPVAMLAACIAGLSPTASATTMVKLSTNQIVDAADIIVRGTVTEVWSEEDENGVVWTRAQLEVTKTYKGDPAKTTHVIDRLGRTFGGHVSVVHGSTRFSPGEDAVFFLETLGSGRLSTVGLSQGKYTLQLDPYSRETIAHRFIPAPGQAYDHRFLPLPDENMRVSLSDFEETITNRATAGWDGEPIPGVSLDRLQRINAKGSVQ